MKLAVPAFVLSWTLIIAGVGYGIHRGKAMMGVDFAGGAMVRLSSPQPVDIAKVRSIVEGAKLGEATITRFQGGAVQGVQVTVGTQGNEKPEVTGQKVEQVLMSQ